MAKRVTLDEVARKARVSKATASYVLNGRERKYRISEGTAERVRHAAAELDYIPDRTASLLRKGRHHLIALVAPHIADFYAGLLRSIEDEAEVRDFQILFGSTFDNIERERKYLNSLISRRIEGVVILPIDIHAPHLEVLRRRHVPTVFFRRRADSSAPQMFMTFNDFEVGRMAAEHLIARGCRRIVYVSTPTYVELDYLRIIHEARSAGCHEALTRSGLPVLDISPLLFRPYVPESGQAFVEALRERKVDGLVCIADDVGAFAMQLLRQGGLPSPDAVRVMGCNDSQLAGFTSPLMTSVALPKAQLGESMVRALFQMIDNQRQDMGEVLLSPSLVERESTA